MVRHTVELKMPKLFGKKKADTEIHLEDKKISVALLVGTPLVLGITIGYLVGFKQGVGKGGISIVVVRD